MTEQIFIQILNMSLTASAVIAAVLFLRLLLKKAPKIFSYCLWACVLFRLLCPVSFTAAFSLFSFLQAPSAVPGKLAYLPQDWMLLTQTDTNTSIQEPSNASIPQTTAAASPVHPVAQSAHTAGTSFIESTESIELLFTAASFLWLAGMLFLLLSNVRNLSRLQRRLKTAVWEKENIYLTNEISAPFVIGIFRPRIYLPLHLEAGEKEYVLLHEQIHIRRKDHILRLAGYLALCLHWFNPLVWAAFFLSGKDMEMSCDEAVIRQMGKDIKKEYSSSLLSMTAGISFIHSSPLAFGEGNTKSRIQNILHYKTPAARVVKGTALLCGIAVIILLANPVVHAEDSSTNSSQNRSAGQSRQKTQTSTNTSTADTASDNAGVQPPLSDSPENGKQNLYRIGVQSISRDARVLDAYVPPMKFTWKEGEPLAFADDCRFFVNRSMNRMDYREISFDVFATLIEIGGDSLQKSCLLKFEDGQIVYAALQSAWDHYGITPISGTGISAPTYYDTIVESNGEQTFYHNFSLVSSETMDIADSEGIETIEVYTKEDWDVDAGTGIVLFKDASGSVLFTQEAYPSRAGWNNIYLGSTDDGSFILTFHMEDRWNYGEFRYEAFRLNSDGTPIMQKASAFNFHLSEGSNLVYNDTIFQNWIAPLEEYLQNSHLILSSQDGEIRTEKISEADKYNYSTLSLKERAIELSKNYENSLIPFHDSWYSKRSLKKETVEWLLWYNRLSDMDQLAVSSVPPELTEAEHLIGIEVEDAADEQ